MKKTVVKTMAIVLTAATITCALPMTALAAPRNIAGAPLHAVTVTAESAMPIVNGIKAKKYTAYASSPIGLNIREEANTDSRIINEADLNEVIHVTGIVFENGIDTGWRRIDTTDMETGKKCIGFVDGDFLSTKPVAVQNIVINNNNNNNNNNPDRQAIDKELQAEAESDQIADVIDRAQESGLFTQEEISAAVAQLQDLYNKRKGCTDAMERENYSDQIANILDEMIVRMDNAKNNTDQDNTDPNNNDQNNNDNNGTNTDDNNMNNTDDNGNA